MVDLGSDGAASGSPASDDPVSAALAEAAKKAEGGAADGSASSDSAGPGSRSPSVPAAKRRGKKRRKARSDKGVSRARASSSSAAAAPDAARAAAADALAAAPRGLPRDAGVDDPDGVDDAPKGVSLSEVEFAELIEFFLWGGFRLIPEKVGGGDLSDTEQRMLGKVWSRALLPLVDKYAAEAPLAVAAITTAEVILKRAMLARVSVPVSSPDADAK